MRNLFLALLLANLLFLAWQWWVEPQGAVGAGPEAGADLVLVDEGLAGGPPPPGVRSGAAPLPAAGPDAMGSGSPPARPPSGEDGVPPGRCIRFGPMPDEDSARRAASQLDRQGYATALTQRTDQAWLGHWVQITGFSTPQQAEAARQRLMAGGLVDVYLMQDGASSVVSLGVFRERARAERVLAAAQKLGFSPVIRDRFRATAESWVVVGPLEGRARPSIPDLGLGSAAIVRAEAAVCPPGPGTPPAASAPPVP